MHLLYIHQYFKTPSEGGGTRSYWICLKLIEEGFEITVLTTSSTVSSIKKTKIEGINVVYFPTSYNQSMNVFQRAISFISFALYTSFYVIRHKGFKLIIATSTPLTVGLPALIAKKVKKTPFIFEVRDLWPEVPIQLGAISNPIVIKIIKYFERIIYTEAEQIIALSPGMEAGVISSGTTPEKVHVIPNMAKIDIFYPRKKAELLLKTLELKSETLKIIHFGAIGAANDIETLIKSIILHNDCNFDFIFLGSGSQEFFLKKMCEVNKLTNVHFLGPHSLYDTSIIVNECDISLVSFKDLPVLWTNSPNKFFDTLSAGKPLIVNSKGWTKDIVEEYKCGFYINPDEPSDLFKKLNILRQDKTLRENMGRNSREVALKKFDKSILTAQFVRLTKQVCSTA